MIFIRGPVSFYTLRFLLGAAEAGFFPGMILYMKHWFPPRARARAVAWFMTANPLAGVVGSPISGALLELHGSGLAGWQWLFLLEGIPAVVLGLAVYWVMTESPEKATWLTEEHRAWLLHELKREQIENSGQGEISVWRVLGSGRAWLLSLIYFGVPACMYGVTLWLPTMIRGLSGLGYFATGMVAALPYCLTAVAMVLVGRHSDRSGERRWHTALAGFVGAGALVAAAYSRMPILMIAGMSLGMMGAESMVGPFWAMATSRWSGAAAATSIAVINAVANLGGYFGPYIIGFASSDRGDFRGGLLAVGVVLAICAAAALLFKPEARKT